MVIRAVTRADIPDLVPLMLSYIVDFYERPNPGSEAVTQLVAQLLEHPDSGIQFVADDQALLVGFATLYFTFSTLQAKRAAILNDLFVHPAHRGQKIGERLFQHCLDYVRSRGWAYMQWETARDNVVAQALYNKMGGQVGDWLLYEIE
ncbi:GNAT family N-acetyltransferase [Sulfobacillus harzensis]|uniref:GNAT family N-acetyltransferase n=1 Tax=Sulfobacillus harzensis TaxID=2729629 RepID=A0A7Y0L286_9FIRM|nr:GNAT family N-acetyltransferase [Sulfobacillus harzensis]NMP21718.1 GNAT family N-acetyltransferase [Sulfobacillus harzensis]